MESNNMPELGSKISLISKADIRYEGKLFTVDPQDCTIALANVKSFGTEDRATDHPVPAQVQVYDYILFRATDIKDISVIPSPPVLFDPAILQLSVPPSIGSSGVSSNRFPGMGFQHPIVGTVGSQEGFSRTVGGSTQSSYNPMQSSSLLNPLQQRSRQTSESQRFPGSVVVGSGSGGGGGAATASRSSTPGLGRRQDQGGNTRQSPTRFNSDNQPSQRNRNNSHTNSNQEDRNYGNQYSQNKGRGEQGNRFGNRNAENGFGRDNRNNGPNRDNRNPEGGFAPDNRPEGGFRRESRNDGGFNRDNRNEGGFNHRDNRNDNGYNRENRNDNGYNRDNMFGGRNDNYSRNNQQQNMQPRRYQNAGGQQQRSGSRGRSGERQPEQQRGAGQRRNNQGQRAQGGGGQRGGRGMLRQRPFHAFPKQTGPKQPLKFDSDYDFDKANTEFEELRHTLAQVKISEGNSAAPQEGVVVPNEDKKDDSGNETAVGECDQEDEGVQQLSAAYDKTKSFFDNISCEAIERSKGRSQRTDWRKELKLNTETFGVTMSRRFYVPRGRGYYNRGGSWNYKPRQQNNIIVAKV